MTKERKFFEERLFILYLTSLQLLGAVIFIFGFFPARSNNIYSTNDLPIEINGLKIDKNLYKKQVSKIVIVLVDAMRYDFLFRESDMPFVSKAIKSNLSCLIKTKVQPPTVTLPRIKALMTGTIPSFFDVLTNFGSTELKEDNFIRQAVNNKLKVVFYGDDTWLKLYPGSFIRSEGVSSFFVSDFTEVDKNVTRNVQKEMIRNDWDILILHYLGLDHIGHLEGPFSKKIGPKLLEMDKIIEQIYFTLKKKDQVNDLPSILVICGDHGMKDSGGHGGTTRSEILVPTLILNHKCDSSLRNKESEQVDFTPLISFLLGQPIPGGSVGVLSEDLLTDYPMNTVAYSLYYNTKRLMQLLKLNGLSTKTITGVAKYTKWIHDKKTKDYLLATQYFYNCQRQMADNIIKTSSQFDMYLMCFAIIIYLQIGLICMNKYNNIMAIFAQKWYILGVLLGAHSIFCASFNCESVLCDLSPGPIVLTLLLYGVTFANSCVLRSFSLEKVLARNRYMLGIVLYPLTFLSSSYIEEEHQYWYFITTAVLIFLLPKDYSIFMLLILFRVLRKLNQTGDKWSHIPDISKWIILPENIIYMSIIHFIGLLLILIRQICCLLPTPSSLIEAILIMAQFTFLYLYRVAIGSCVLPVPYTNSKGVIEVQLFWWITVLRLTLITFEHYHNGSPKSLVASILNLYTSCLALMMKPQNTILIPALSLFSSAFYKQYYNDVSTLSILHLWLGQAFYFLQGNSNSFASIDVTAGYIGREEYNMIKAGLSIFLHTFAGPMLSLLLLLSKNTLWYQGEFLFYHTLLFFNSLNFFIYLILITLQRYHLFIWTVFAPKLLYLMAQMVAMMMCLLVSIIIRSFGNYSYIILMLVTTYLIMFV